MTGSHYILAYFLEQLSLFGFNLNWLSYIRKWKGSKSIYILSNERMLIHSEGLRNASGHIVGSITGKKVSSQWHRTVTGYCWFEISFHDLFDTQKEKKNTLGLRVTVSTRQVLKDERYSGNCVFLHLRICNTRIPITLCHDVGESQ